MYQQYLDEDESWKTVEKDQDPFWDAPEDLAIGSVRVFNLFRMIFNRPAGAVIMISR